MSTALPPAAPVAAPGAAPGLAAGAAPARAAFVLHGTPSAAVRQRLAAQDLREGLGLWRLFATLGWLDIRLRYRGSILGPFWLTLSTGVMVAALGVLYSALFKMSLPDYLPFLAVSLVLWGFVSSIVAEGSTCFTQSEGMIRSVRMPFTVHAARVVVRNLLVLGHNLLVIVVVYAAFDRWPGAAALLVLPGLALWIVDALAISALLGAICARFRDIAPIVGSIMSIAFFVSPIIWKPELLTGDQARWLPFNPFYTLLEIVRAPMLGAAADWHVWASALGFSAALCVAAWVAFVRVRSRLSFWV